MKKKIFLIASLCMLVLGLAACGEDSKKADYNGVSYDQLQSTGENLATNLTELKDEDIDGNISYSEQMGDTLIPALLTKWKELKPELGDYVGLGAFSIDKSGKTLTTSQIMKFTGRDLTLTCVYNYLDMQISDITLDENYTLGEKMQKAAMNTLMGLGTVFTILVLISFIIAGFKVIPYLQEKAKAKNAPQAEPAPAHVPAPVLMEAEPEPQPEEALQDELELIAVIAAAIAAARGAAQAPADGFVVRSIKRRKQAKR